MPASETVIIELRLAGLQQFQAQTALASAGVKNIGDTSKKQAREPGKMGKALGTMGVMARTAAFGGVAAVGTGLAAAAVTGLKFNAEMENAQTRFKLFTGSAKEARDVVGQVNDVASKSTFARTELSNAAAMMGVAGIRGDKLKDSLQAVANATAAMGGSGADLQGIAQVFQQIQTAGKLTYGDLQQLAGRGIPVFQLLQKELGLTNKQLRDKLTKGSISAAKGLGVITKTFTSGKMAKAAEDQANTVSGQMSNLVGRTTRTLGTLLQPLFNWIKTAVLPVITNVSRGIAEWADAGGLQRVGKALGALSPIFDAVADAAKQWWWAIKPIVPYLRYLIPVLKIVGIVIGVALIVYLKALTFVFKVIGREIRIFIGIMRAVVPALIAAVRWVIRASFWLDNMAKKIFRAVIGAFKAMIRWVVNAGKTLGRFGGAVISGVTNAFNKAVGAVKSAGKAIAGAVGTAFRAAVSAGKRLVSGFLELGKSIVKAIADGIKSAPGLVLDAVGSVIDSLPLPGIVKGKVKSALGFQHGGTVPPNSGFQLVGERGPELASFRPGTRITPLNSLALPNMPSVAGMGGDQTIRVPVYLDSRVLTEAVASRVRSKQARK